MKKLTVSNYRSMPWKNGGGTTIEIAVFPEHAAIDNFIWRISRAKVVSDGPFSVFSGVDRSLALLSGSGVQLTVDDAILQVDATNNVATFSGDAKTYAQLIDGEVSDFNVMTRRSMCKHRLAHWTGAATRPLLEDTVLLYCAQGSGKLLAKSADVEQEEVEIRADEAIRFLSNTKVGNYVLQTAVNSRFYCVYVKLNQT